MKPKLLRRVVILLIAVLGFAQASVTFAACPIERGSLAQVVAPMEDACGDCGTVATAYISLYANRCAAHCTADLQLPGPSVAILRSPTDTPVLLVANIGLAPLLRTGLEASPPGTPPRRILLHSFLI